MSQHLLFGPQLPNASALQTTGNLGVYGDRNCLSKVSSINWGTLTPGQSKKVTVYARNEGNQTIFLFLMPQNWNPVSVSNYLAFSWTMQNIKITKGGVAQVTLILYVSLYVTGVSTFSFNIVFNGSDHLLGDFNKNGVVDLKDVMEVATAYGSSPGSPKWNSVCDLNGDLVVDMKDYLIVCKNYGQRS
jgi:hypothetical protein